MLCGIHKCRVEHLEEQTLQTPSPTEGQTPTRLRHTGSQWEASGLWQVSGNEVDVVPAFPLSSISDSPEECLFSGRGISCSDVYS